MAVRLRSSVFTPSWKHVEFFSNLFFRITCAALRNAHGQCDQIFAKVEDGRLLQRKPAGSFEKNNPNLGKPCFSTYRLEVKYAVGKQISAQYKVT